MMLLPCPFCGNRPESEFHYAGDFGKVRPEGFEAVSDEDWASYLYNKINPRGETAEIWKHVTCQEVFGLKRDTVSHVVTGTITLHAGGRS